MSDDLEASIRQCKTGNSSAYERVVRRFEHPLRAWLASLAPPGIDVDDVAQQTFIAAYQRLDDYEAETNFAAWLFTIARFQLRTETNRLRRIADYHTRYAPDLLLRELERRDLEPPETVVEQLNYLNACTASLSDNALRFITWRYEEEISLQEMATRSGRSVAAVKKQLWKLRRKLHDCVLTKMELAKGGIS
ncbi:MAG: sigma-70 family RNA polymerase sigma factor [Verrucomicrobiales bacterium]|nr:sigma-70 family RNA polymerase sigma factor [Verrucomicrobiales bacterium]